MEVKKLSKETSNVIPIKYYQEIMHLLDALKLPKEAGSNILPGGIKGIILT